jgi:hypothetical protein
MRFLFALKAGCFKSRRFARAIHKIFTMAQYAFTYKPLDTDALSREDLRGYFLSNALTPIKWGDRFLSYSLAAVRLPTASLLPVPNHQFLELSVFFYQQGTKLRTSD